MRVGVHYGANWQKHATPCPPSAHVVNPTLTTLVLPRFCTGGRLMDGLRWGWAVSSQWTNQRRPTALHYIKMFRPKLSCHGGSAIVELQITCWAVHIKEKKNLRHKPIALGGYLCDNRVGVRGYLSYLRWGTTYK